jgi:hypothetical protein
MKAILIDPANVPLDEGGYPTWEWPTKADHLLFDIGFSYAILSQAEIMLEALVSSLKEHETSEPTSAASEANRELRERLDELLAKMRNFRAKRFLADRDEVYEAGYALGKRFDAKEAAE